MADLIKGLCQAQPTKPLGTGPGATKAPEWAHLVPLGEITARDGRTFNLSNPEAVLAAFAANRADIPVDYEHQNEMPGKDRVGPVPAAGWIKEMRIEDTGIWGRIEWTARARELIEAKEYRYLSPVIMHAKDGQIVRIRSAALVHTPALYLTALASEETPMNVDTPVNDDAPLLQRLAQRLGLPAGLDEDGFLEAVQALMADALKVAESSEKPGYVAPFISAEMAEMIRRHDEDKAEMAEIIAARKVEKAEECGYLSGGMRAWANELVRKDPAMFDKFIKGTPPMFAHLLSRRNTPGNRPLPAPPASELERAVCSQLGLSESRLSD